ncbi:hypothetical protein SM19410_21780 [Xanthomonas hortorum pv. gardneri]|nr:hypothetical protein XGA_2592 [Xanthomonas hortorum ATCC 19865]KLA91254.1 hypothetical protein SM19410_21780 [Xanthomonas hortorum pv. gardneri]KLA93825.1 hypothetical protein SM18210_22290 [Xanthomonas hortorum pv. gardneri]KLA94923.1 hypothetical protein SM17710_18875 [Xanthomonas hortorum pv. gardneri]KLB05152.1 hypothetical protein SM23410_21985 [Xanthomonas hortorum pv. gardneri]
MSTEKVEMTLAIYSLMQTSQTPILQEVMQGSTVFRVEDPLVVGRGVQAFMVFLYQTVRHLAQVWHAVGTVPT